MKKIVLSLATLAFSVFAFSTEVEFSTKTYNEDPFYLHTDADDENKTDFPSLKNKTSVKYESDKVDAFIEALAAIDDYNDKNFGIDGYINDWYVEFRPFQNITVALHDNIYADGSSLPIYDDNIAGGNIGSDGVTLIYTPSIFKGNLQLAGTLPFDFSKNDFKDDDVNYFKSKNEENDTEYADTGFGAIYTTEFFQASASVKDIFDDDKRLFGAYISLPGIFGATESLTIGGGISFTDSKNYSALGFDDFTWFGGVKGEKLVSANLSFENDSFALAADFVSNLGEEYEEEVAWDLYTAASVSFGISDSISASLGTKFMADTKGKNKAENVYGVNTSLDFNIDGHNAVGIGFEYQTFDKNFDIAVPVYWQWTL